MRRLMTGIGLLWLMTLAACSAGGAEPTAGQTATSAAEPTRGALATVVSETGGEGSAPTAPAAEPAYPAGTPTTAAAYPAATGAPADYPVGTLGASAAETPQEMPMPGQPLSEPMQKLVDSMVADLSAVSGAPADEMKVVSVEPTTWSDGSLGCPAPDMMYTQVLVDGYRVTVQAGGQTYEYHTSGLRSWVRCENGRPASSGTAGG